MELCLLPILKKGVDFLLSDIHKHKADQSRFNLEVHSGGTLALPGSKSVHVAVQHLGTFYLPV